MKISKDKDYVSGDGIKVTSHMDNFDLGTFQNEFVECVKRFKESVLDLEFK